MKHLEAFMLMEYTCKGCHEAELIWNSRDGVTPFCITCRKCQDTMQHTKWQNDLETVNYVPPNGSRFFVDMTYDMAIRKVTERIKEIDREYDKEAVEAMAKDLVGSPVVMTQNVLVLKTMKET